MSPEGKTAEEKLSRLGGTYSGACRKGDRFKMEET